MRSRKMALPAISPRPRTGDAVFDVMFTGYKWDVGAGKTLNWGLSHGFYAVYGEVWSNPGLAFQVFSGAFASIAQYVDVRFNYVGLYGDPGTAYRAGVDLTMSVDATNRYPSAWAWAHFPDANDREYVGAPGDVFLNLNSQAAYLPSYAPGSAGFALMLHEIGHALGLKHPHDNGGTGAPTFKELGLGYYDKDWATIMSYRDDFQWNLVQWEPATYMVLDVLALQAMYGANQATNTGASTHAVSEVNRYITIWDAGGTDSVDASAARAGWTIELPNTALSSQNPAKVGYATPTADLFLASPKTLYWIVGDVENATGSAFDDRIYGTDGRNEITGGRGNDMIDGKGGVDTAVYSRPSGEYVVSRRADGGYSIDHRSGSRADGTDTVYDVEFARFSDGVRAVARAPNQITDVITKLYVGYYDRAPDPVGGTYWTSELARGMPITDIANSFAVQTESTSLYTFLANPNASNAAAVRTFVDAVYANLFERAPDGPGADYWTSAIQGGRTKVGNAILDIISGARLNDLATIVNKVDVGNYYDGQIYDNAKQFTLASARSVLANVNASPASVSAGRAAVDAYVRTAPSDAAAYPAPAPETQIVGIVDQQSL